MKPKPEETHALDEQSPNKSPVRLLLRHFRASRDSWKAKALRRSGRIHNLEQKIRDLEDSRSNWKDKSLQLRANNLLLEKRLAQVELQRDQLQAQLADSLSKKLPPLSL